MKTNLFAWRGLLLSCAVLPGLSGIARFAAAEQPRPPATQPVKIKADPTQPATRTWPQWESYHERFLTRVKDAKKWPVDVVFFGDSITEWWPWEDFRDRITKPLRAANFGIGGDRVQNVLWRVLNGEMDDLNPKVAVLLIGTNNLGENTAEEIAAGITKITEAIQQRSPTTKILLLGIFPRSDYAALKNKAAQVNAIIAKLHDGDRLRFADIGQEFLNPDGSVKDGVLKDKLHLTVEGYNIWYNAMSPILTEMLSLPTTHPASP